MSNSSQQSALRGVSGVNAINSGMKCYYFHLNGSGKIDIDDNGLELIGLEAALEMGVTAARDIMSDDVRQGRLCLDLYFVIEESGAEVARVHFKEVLEITGS